MTDDAPSRLPRIADPESDPLLREQFAARRASGGRILNLHLTNAHSPALSKAQWGTISVIRTQTKPPQSLFELAILRTAQICECEYEVVQHIPMALRAGLTRAQIDAVAQWRGSSLFDERQRALLAWVEAMMTNKGDVDDATFDELARHFSPQEIVELTTTATLYYGTGLMMKALRIRLEPESRAAADRAGR